ncbi:MAG: hypothetical protein NTV34_00745 [Proteobacteria bacterium]|nr:hypothetical protein [Pseudomonadota bacterium]
MTINSVVYEVKSLKKDKTSYFRQLDLKLNASELARVETSGVFSLLANVFPNAMTFGSNGTDSSCLCGKNLYYREWFLVLV